MNLANDFRRYRPNALIDSYLADVEELATPSPAGAM